MHIQKDSSNPNIFSIADGVTYDLPVASLARPEPGGIPASTFGWTLVNAVTAAEVDAAWAPGQAASTDFAFDLGSNIRISGSHGKIAIYDGGPTGLQSNGRFLYLGLPISSGVLTRDGGDETVSPGVMVVQVPLSFDPSVPVSAPVTDSGTQHVLLVDWSGTASDPVIIDYLFDGDGSLSPASAALFKAGFSGWLAASAAAGRLPKLDIATVTINKKFSQFFWLQLSQVSYAYLSAGTDTPGALGIMGGTTSPGAFHNIAPGIIPAGSRAAALIGSQAFTRDVLLPAAAAAFDGATVDDFELSENDSAVFLRLGKTLSIPPVNTGADTYELTITQFSLIMREQEIVNFVEAKTEVEPGVTLYVDVTQYYGLQLITKDDGSQTLDYVITKPSVATHRVHNSTGAIIGKVLLSVILTLVFSISGAIAKKLGDKIMLLILASILKGLVTLAQNLLPKLLQDGVRAAMPPIDEMIDAMQTSVAWAGESGRSFSASGAQVNGSVQFFGTFT